MLTGVLAGSCLGIWVSSLCGLCGVVDGFLSGAPSVQFVIFDLASICRLFSEVVAAVSCVSDSLRGAFWYWFTLAAQ